MKKSLHLGGKDSKKNNPFPELPTQAIFQTVPTPFLILKPDAQFTIFGVNDAYLRVTMKTRGNIISKSLFVIFPEDPANREAEGTRNFRASLQRVVQNHQQDEMPTLRYDIPKPDIQGEFDVHYWNITNTPILDEKGELSFIVQYVEDVTKFVLERNRMAEIEAAIHVQEKKAKDAENLANAVGDHHNSLLKMLPVGVFYTDLNDRCLQVNSKWEEITGLSLDKIKDKEWTSFAHPDDHHSLAKTLRTYKKSETQNKCEYEFRILVNGNQERWLLLQLSPERDLNTNNVIGYIGTVVDITRQKELEKAEERHLQIEEPKRTVSQLQATETDFQLLTNISPSGIVHIDIEGNLVYMNPKASQILGLPQDKHTYEEWQLTIHPEDRQHIVKHLQRSISRKKEYFKYEFRFLRPDDTTVYAQIEFIASKDTKGQIASYVGTITDVTKSKLIAARLAEKQNVLLQQAADYRKKMEGFIDTLCHELRNPANAIYGNVSLSKMMLKSMDSLLDTLKQQTFNEILAKKINEILTEFRKNIAEFEENINEIDKCVIYLKALLDNVLQISKLEAGKISLEEVECDPKKIIHEAIALLRSLIEQKKLPIYTNLPEQKIYIKADPYRLKQILVNLLSNAIKFSPLEGTICLYLTPIHQNEETELEFAVKDYGIGMSMEEQARLFNRFEQVGRKTEQEYGGSGLGLVICKELIDLMKGSIKVDSEKGKGTKISFTIKFHTVNPEEKPQELAEEKGLKISTAVPLPLPKTKLNILVVDDDSSNRLVLARYLSKRGYQYKTANNGKEAVDAFTGMHEDTRFDLILMDIQMPIMDGFEATKNIRAKEREKPSYYIPIPIIALTGHASDEYRMKTQRAGMNDLITKPFELSDLEKKIIKCVAEAATMKRVFPSQIAFFGQPVSRYVGQPLFTTTPGLEIPNRLPEGINLSGALEGLSYQRVEGDGSCFYYALALYCGLDKEQLRALAGEGLEDQSGALRQFVPHISEEEFNTYVARVKINSDAEQPEIEALGRIFNRPIIIIGPDSQILNPDILTDKAFFSPTGDVLADPIFVYYNGINHYDALTIRSEFDGRNILRALIKEQQVPVAERKIRIPLTILEQLQGVAEL
jgi:PAS domain S-box-containing protein